MTKLIIDTDPGVDDAMAILFAALHPEIEIVGLTSVFGNVPIETATRNALNLLEMAKINAPVAQGAEVPLVIAPHGPVPDIHGEEGFGALPARYPKGTPDTRTAAEFIVDTLRAHPHDITLCPVGPLTNIADALRLDPAIAGLVKEVVIMGGAYRGGNVSDVAEANIWNDPHAADQVFAADWPLTMIGLDVTNTVTCTKDDFAQVAASAPVLGGFLSDAASFYIDFYEARGGVAACALHDPAAVIACIRPELFSVEKHKVEVIVNGEEIGRTQPVSDSARPETRIALGVDGDAVKSLFLETLKSGY